MRRVLSWIVLLIGLIPLWAVFLRFYGIGESGYLIAATFLYVLCITGLAIVSRRPTVRGWLIAGLIILLGLFVPTRWLMENSGSPLSLGETIIRIAIFLWPSFALIMAAVLMFHGFSLLAGGMNPAGNGQDDSQTGLENSKRLAIACLALSGLLILKTLHNLYWLTVWDTTYDPLGYIWIVVPVLVAVFSGALLIINLQKQAALAGLAYLVLVPGLLIAVSTFAQQVDFRQVTERRAEQVSRRVEAYYTREGRYPMDLKQLGPWYVFPLPEPMIMYDQDWCYLAGEDYYQLGYVYREHWSSPELIGRVYSTGGQAPENEKICAKEIEALIRREPFFYEK